MSDYNQSQPLVMASIKIGGYVLTEAELNKFVKLDSYRKIPSEYIGCDVRVNVYTLTEYAALQWIPHPSMGDVAIVFDSDENKSCYNGTYVYQSPDVGNCIPPSPCDVPPEPCTRVVNIANWKLVNPTISYDDIVKWNEYTNSIGVIRQDIIDIRTLIGSAEVSINNLTNNKIELAKTELTTTFKADDNVVRSEFTAADTILQSNLDSIEDKFDGEVNRIDQNIIDFKAKEVVDVNDLQSQITNNKENIRLNTRDLGDLDTKFDRTVEQINTSVDQKVTLLNNEVTSKLTQNQSVVDGKIAAQDSKLTAATANLNDNITSVRNTINNVIDGLRTQVGSDIDTLEDQTETSITQSKNQLQQQINTLQGVDGNLNTRITNEVATLNNTINTKESNLNDRINSEVDNINGKIVVENTKLDQKITTNNATLTAAIATEKSGRQDGDSVLDVRITNEVATLNNTIAAEKSTIMSSLNTNVSSLNSIINSKESTLRTTITENKNDIDYKFDQHVLDTDLHVTAAKQAIWNAKVDVAGLNVGLATKANISDVYTKQFIDNKVDEINTFILAKSKEHFQGFFATTAELPQPGQQGWYAICGTTDTIWIWNIETLAWVDSKAMSAVTSVNNQSGVVVLTKADVGLANVNNTSDENKPISTAVSSALSTKVDKVDGKQLSTNDYDAAAVGEVAKVANKADKTYVDAQDALKADKTYVDNLPSTTAFVGVFDTKALLPVDGNNGQFLVCKEDDLIYVWDQGFHAWISSLDKTYTKIETDNKLSLKADEDEVTASLMLKADVDATEASLNTKVDKVDGKQLSTNDYDAAAVGEVAKVANKADKTYVDAQDALKANVTDLTQLRVDMENLPSKNFIGVFVSKSTLPTGEAGQFAVTTTEDKLWVWDGNLDNPDWVSYYLTKEVDAALAEKADKTYVDAQDALKADEATVATRLAEKANVTDMTASLAEKASIDFVNGQIVSLNQSIANVTKFRGYFATAVDIQNISEPKNGDYAICQTTNTVWYCKAVGTNAPVWVDGDVNGEVTLSQFNTELALKANVVDVYTKIDSDSKFATIATVGNIQGQLDAKAIADQVYTITAADNKFVTQTIHNAFVGSTNASLDEKANETSVVTRLALKADKTYVDAQDALKADEATVVTRLAEKADITYVDTQDGIITSSLNDLSTLVGNVSSVASDTTAFGKIAKLAGDVLLKANATNVYTKTESNETFATIASVNGQLAQKANTSAVESITSELATKVNTETYNSLVSTVGTKVDKVAGKGLSTNDYDDVAVAKVDKIGSSSDAALDTGTLFARIAFLTEKIARLENRIELLENQTP